MQLVKREPSKVYMDRHLWIPKEDINVDVAKAGLTFTALSQKKADVHVMWFETENHLIVPREYWRVFSMPDKPIIDCRPTSYKKVVFQHRIKPDPEGGTTQTDAYNALWNSDGGTLQLRCGGGKTVIFLYLMAQMQVPTLIVVDNTDLLRNWHEKIVEHLNIDKKDIGFLMSGKFDWNKKVVLATYHTIAAKEDSFQMTEEIRRHFGLIGFDEGHHISAPTFSKCAAAFYGKRISLTATPEREDGMHIVSEYHIGPVLYKNLRHDKKPNFLFIGTGFKLDTKPEVFKATHDINGELHLNKLSVYFGQWKERLNYIIKLVRSYYVEGRRIIVLSNSVNEILNLCCTWSGKPFVTDLKEITARDLGYLQIPEEMTKLQKLRAEKEKSKLEKELAKNPNSPKRYQHEEKLKEILMKLEKHKIAKSVEAANEKQRTDFIKKTFEGDTEVGAMIAKIPSAKRGEYLRNKRVVFAIAKYGKEGLDSKELDTIIACEPFTSRNGLQQFMGRVLRKPGKEPLVVFLEDDISMLNKMCRKLRSHLKQWPEDQGGPFTFQEKGEKASWR